MCPRESEIIRLVAGELPEPAAARLQRHIAACELCQRMLAQHRPVWDSLGDAVQTPPARDLTAAILAAAAARRAGSSLSPLRIAAAVLMAIGAGVVVGTATPVWTPPTAAAAVDTDAAIDALGLDALVVDQTGLSAALSPAVSAPAPNEERS